MTSSPIQLNRGTGLLVIEVINSNPNGDPDQENDPRWRSDERGEISPVSFKRKLRDLVDHKEGPVWQHIADQMDLDAERFHILEKQGRNRKTILQEIKDGRFTDRYWDGRLFGNTFLEEGRSDWLKLGVAQFGLGLSIAPIEIERLTLTNKAGVEEGKNQGMAPMAYRFVVHGVYTMPFFINPTAATKSSCTLEDIALLLQVIPYAYTHTASALRPSVYLRHAWYMEHTSPLGSCSDFTLIEALTPRRKEDPERPSQQWSDYEVPAELPEALSGRLTRFQDLIL